MSSPIKTAPATASTAKTHLQVIAKLQHLIDQALAPSLAALLSRPYALLDMPDHGNVGDSAIWAGEIAWLQKNLGRNPALIADYRESLEEICRRLSGKSLLFHGGGNFGDVWPMHQAFRESIIAANRSAVMIQFPQSIHYDNLNSVAATATSLKGAKSLRLLVRDHESYELATQAFDCEVVLCPDMAFALGPLQRCCAPDLDVLLLLRTDKERVGYTLPAWPEGWAQDDWLEDVPNLHRQTAHDVRIEAIKSLSVSRMSRAARRSSYYNKLAEQRVKRGLRQLSRARFVITDRLHVHILSTLMGIPHCFLDNHYGKISRFSSAFSTRWHDCYQAKTLAEAVACAQAWLGKCPSDPN
ncbi:polysaccharide pyruvyl transferase family protein [Sphingomonas ursincola]|uniref:Exopolysaccharide biosynthesis protein n=1 Tax=Sphingomonas ursincola TaxID=56361 RepID=A0A7V8U8C7_9SPHN|nr:polysaccharide pyruvyl transferase family protein [Sphingomonas ursincola]MBA1373898.1 exopolysaccharide biosynthesis protein [Sphingomonas ursincola]